jgi:hypothetical protein
MPLIKGLKKFFGELLSKRDLLADINWRTPNSTLSGAN